MKLSSFFHFAAFGVKTILFKKKSAILGTIIVTDKCNLHCKHCSVNNITAIKLPFEYSVLVCPLVLCWYIVTELGSICENAAALGAPLPGFLKKILAVVKNSTEDVGESLTGGKTE